MWEWNEEVHASSVGACLAGLKSVAKLSSIDVPEFLLKEGEIALRALLPRESVSHFADLAQLSLIFPYEIVDAKQRDEILGNIEYHLLRERGVIRWKNDWYYNKNSDGYSEEAEWCFGLSWLAIIYTNLGNKKKAQFFIDRMIATVSKHGVPELYFSHSEKFNQNTPLGWAESLFLVALHEMNEKFLKGQNSPKQTSEANLKKD
jgi:phosphorylase kinase alpha/beta subunit